MKKKYFARLPFFLTAVLLFVFSGVNCAPAQEVFKKFDVAIQILQDSSIEVTETIVAKVENVNINRGIIRSFPVEYTDKNGNPVEVGFDVNEITLDSAAVPWKISRSGRNADVMIGDPDKIITPGLHTFKIKYTASRHIGFFEDHDELYWNVTGSDFSFPVIDAACSVSLPGKPAGEGFNTIEWYIGEYGAKGDKNRARLTADKSVVTTGPLNVGEAMTVVYTWPKGIITPPPPPKQDNELAHMVIAVLTLASVAGWFIFAWNKWGKDPVRKAVIPIFYPPDGASPAHLRYIRDMKLDQTAFTAAIIELAVKGAINIEEIEGEKTFFGQENNRYILHETDTETDKLEPEEEALMMQMFPGDIDTLELSAQNSDILLGAMRSLGRNLRKHNAEIFTRNTDKCIIGIIIYFLGVAALYPFSGEHPLNVILAGICGMIIIALGMRLSKAANSGGQNLKQFLSRLFPPIAVGVIASVAVIDEGRQPFTFIMFTAAAAIISVMRPLMVARTVQGGNILSDIEGLKLYMDTAEKERLEMFNPPEETPELFERLLPYAMALDVAKTWGNRFEKILTKAQYKPDWYTGPSPYLFMNGAGLNAFAHDLNSHIGSVMTPQSAPGTSSGMGGGGFAGGGGGGGGAKGW